MEYTQFRMPNDIHQYLKKEATKNHRTITSQLRKIVEEKKQNSSNK